MRGYLEHLSATFARGWAEYTDGAPSHLYAQLGTEILGLTQASLRRADLLQEAQQSGLQAAGFLLLFNRPIPPDAQNGIEIRAIPSRHPLARLPALKLDRYPLQRIFILGSPRSGTSELGATLAKTFQLPWLGELHAAHLFAEPAAALRGDVRADKPLPRFLAEGSFAEALQTQAKHAYYGLHGSASFLDKTPGVPMIRAAPFLAACFPDAKFIYLRRNGVANVLSRLVKFGGNFQAHCADWAAALTTWAEIRASLPHYLELDQEDMQANPGEVAAKIAAYLGAPDTAQTIAESLRAGTLERTGAGLGRSRLAETSWSPEQTTLFLRLCGPTMQRFGYEL